MRMAIFIMVVAFYEALIKHWGVPDYLSSMRHYSAVTLVILVLIQDLKEIFK
jgi:hypothetical protein